MSAASIAMTRVERDAAWWSLVLEDVRTERARLSPFESYAIARFSQIHGRELRKMAWVGAHYGHLSREARCHVLAENSVAVQGRSCASEMGRTKTHKSERSSMQ